MKLFYTAIICLLFSFEVNAQLIENELINFKGIVFNEYNEPLSDVHILINSKQGVLTTKEGFFSFNANANDSVIFSYMGYKTFNFIVPDTLMKLTYITGIFLKRDTLLLPEVIVLPFLNKQQFRQAFVNNQMSKNDALAKANINQFSIKVYNSERNMNMPGVELQQKQFIQNMEYKGLVSPSSSVGISLPYAASFFYNLVINKNNQTKETEYMKKRLLNYKYCMEKQKKKNLKSRK